MHRAFQRIRTGITFFAITILSAIAGYTWLGWSLLDASYMVVITVFGVGYGEVQPLRTPVERIFTMGVIVAGTSSVVYIVGGFVQMVTEGELNRALDTQRRSRTISNLNNHVIICGYGRIGEVKEHLLSSRYGGRMGKLSLIPILPWCLTRGMHLYSWGTKEISRNLQVATNSSRNYAIAEVVFR